MQAPRTIRILALAMSMTLASTALSPAMAAAASSGEATSTAVEVSVTAAGDTTATTTTIAESTAATNSSGGIVADTPSTPEDESIDTTVVTSTPIRVEDEQVMVNPESIQASAPGSALASTMCNPCSATDSAGVTSTTTGGSFVLADEDAGFVSGYVQEASLSTGVSSAEVGQGISNSYILLGTPGGPESDLISGFAGAGTGDPFAQDGPQTSPSTYLDGYITLGQASVQLFASADGSTSSVQRTFTLTDLRLLDAPDGNTLIYVSEGTGFGEDALTIVLTVTIGAGTADITVAAGADLLSAAIYAGTSLEDDFLLIQPQLTALTGAGGALEGLSITIGEGFVDEGDGTYGRTEMTAVEIAASPNGASDVVTTIGHAYIGVDAVRDFSTATNPELPPGIAPISNPDVAFPGTHAAVPVETVVSNEECGPEDDELFSNELDADCAEADGGGAAAADVTPSDELPRTGLGLGTMLLASLVLLVLGGAMHGGASAVGRRAAVAQQ